MVGCDIMSSMLQVQAAVQVMQQLIDSESPGVAALMLHRLQQQADKCWGGASGDCQACVTVSVQFLICFADCWSWCLVVLALLVSCLAFLLSCVAFLVQIAWRGVVHHRASCEKASAAYMRVVHVSVNHVGASLPWVP